MKKNLGKIFLILIIIQTTLLSEELAHYKLFANKQTAHIKEPIQITFKAEQVDKKNVMFFLVKPKKSKNYTIKLLTSKTQEETYHHTVITYTYVLFPLKSQKLSIDFDFSVTTASDKGVVHAYVADHDESNGIDSKITKIKVKPLSILVQTLKHPVDIVGDFTLKRDIDKDTIEQFGSANVIYTLNGYGYNPNILLPKKIRNVTIFSDINQVENRLTKRGYKIKREYIYSFSSSVNFTIPSIMLKAYSPSKNIYYTINIPKQDIKVNAIKSSTLLDKEDSPKIQHYLNNKQIKQFFIYLLIFFTGYITAKLTNYKRIKGKNNKIFIDIKESSQPMQLVFILLNKYKYKNITHFIKELEELKYSKGKRSFQEIKQAILEEFM